MKNPRRLVVKIRNNSKRFVSLLKCYEIQLFNAEGQLKVCQDFVRKHRNLTPYRGIITYQKTRKEQFADTFFYLLPKVNFGKLDYEADTKVLGERPQFAVHFQYYYGRQPGYEDGDVLVLLFNDEEVSRYPEPAALAPRLQRTLTTSWGALKR